MNEISESDFDKLLKVIPDLNYEKIDDLRNVLKTYFKNNSLEKSVLGFDIYQYSKYKNIEQSLVPIIYKKLYEETINNIISLETCFFQNYKNYDDFSVFFIDTGDGGFQIFENPFQALIFALYFQANLKKFNSYHFLPELRHMIGEINLRYALTYDHIFKFKKNYYGPAIINNSRIMAKDKLNRFLLDSLTNSWFDIVFNGIENLKSLYFKDLIKINLFSKNDIKDKNSVIFPKDWDSDNSIQKIDILKIGEIESKGDKLSVFSLHIQVLLKSEQVNYINKFTITLGNLNPFGLN